MNFLDKLRNKNEKQKKMIAFFLAGFLILIIVFLWLNNFGQDGFVPKKEEEESIKKTFETPFSMIKDTFGEISTSIGGAMEMGGSVMEQIEKEKKDEGLVKDEMGALSETKNENIESVELNTPNLPDDLDELDGMYDIIEGEVLGTDEP